MKAKLRIPKTPEYLRSEAARAATRITAYGWRPRQEDLTLLRSSVRDAAAYKICLQSWRRAGFPLTAIKRLAGRPVRP